VGAGHPGREAEHAGDLALGLGRQTIWEISDGFRPAGRGPRAEAGETPSNPEASSTSPARTTAGGPGRRTAESNSGPVQLSAPLGRPTAGPGHLPSSGGPGPQGHHTGQAEPRQDQRGDRQRLGRPGSPPWSALPGPARWA